MRSKGNNGHLIASHICRVCKERRGGFSSSSLIKLLVGSSNEQSLYRGQVGTFKIIYAYILHPAILLLQIKLYK